MDDGDIESCLVIRARAGDIDAFAQLYDRHFATVYRYLAAKSPTRHMAEDLTSETFLKALRALPRFTPAGSNFVGWLITIARNLVTDHYRSAWSRLTVVTDEVKAGVDAGPGPELLAISTLVGADLRALVDRLPDDQRECIVLRFFTDLSINETSQVLGRSDGAVRQLQWRATQRLRQLVEHEPGLFGDRRWLLTDAAERP